MVWLPDGGKSLSILYVVVVYYANFVFFSFFLFNGSSKCGCTVDKGNHYSN